MLPFAGVPAVQLLQEAMRVVELNQRLIANNIANVDTPHYNPVRLDFQATLRNALEGMDRVSLRKTMRRHFDVTLDRPEFEGLAFLSKNDYNKVDLDEEMVRLSKNTERYTIYSSLLAKHFQRVKNMLNNIR
ncbi:MAG TPA: flagellar basal body rod protein FlgB [Candidatus Hydrogenedentes bacterium]|nr:flagellar basal body rod protein FlgB [Candidatus Hydrogenedentota bacterium]